MTEDQNLKKAARFPQAQTNLDPPPFALAAPVPRFCMGTSARHLDKSRGWYLMNRRLTWPLGNASAVEEDGLSTTGV